MMVPGVVQRHARGWWVSRRALTPVDEITEAARIHHRSEPLKGPHVLKRGTSSSGMSETWNQALSG